MEDYHPRILTARLREALADTPVVLVNGARQTGKTTLVERIASELDGRYRTLDEPTMLDAALADPVSDTHESHRSPIKSVSGLYTGKASTFARAGFKTIVRHAPHRPVSTT